MKAFKTLVDEYFNKLYFNFKHYQQIDPCNIQNIVKNKRITKKDYEYFLNEYVKWLEYLLIVKYNYGIYRLLLKISTEWRALHVDLEQKQTPAKEPIKIVIDMKDTSNVK